MQGNKVDQLVDVLREAVTNAAPGAHIASVESLMDSIPGGAAIGTVIRAVKEAQALGLPIVAVRGQEGGYFRGPVNEPGAEVDVTDTAGEVGLEEEPRVDTGALLVRARDIRRAVDALIADLEAAAA